MRSLYLAHLAIFCAACAVDLPPPPTSPPVQAVEAREPDAPPAQDVQIGVDGDTYADTDPSALTDFRSTLDPYGSWVDDPTYGTLWVQVAVEVGATLPVPIAPRGGPLAPGVRPGPSLASPSPPPS